MTTLDPTTVAEFRENGFVVTPGLLSADELREYGSVVDRAVADRTSGDDRPLDEKSTYEQSFVQCMRLWETNPDVAPLTFHPVLAEAASELLGADSVLLWQDQALYKEPGGRITDAHQDATFWPVGDAPMVSAWIPFDGSTAAGGATRYVPGSHKAGALKAVDISHRTEPYDILNDPALDGREPVVVEAAPGSVVWHHGMTVHDAAPNLSNRIRRTFTVVFLAAGHRRDKPWPNFPLDRAGVGVGELMEGNGLPVAWPRTEGGFPAPSSVLGEKTGPQTKART